MIEAGAPGTPTAVFTGPGLDLAIESASIEAGIARVRFHITDAASVPLDRAGIYTQGAVSISFVIAGLNIDTQGDPGDYSAYTTRTQTSPITQVAAIQPAADAGGTFREIGVNKGEYEYTFKAAVTPSDSEQTQTIGAWATRVFNNVTYVDNAEYSFVPSGAAPKVRELITNANCNACHGSLRAHGGARRDVQLCTLCHSDGAIDPDTGNSIDFEQMIHKIHSGKDLPSVIAGTPYQIIGFQQSVNDFSTVGFPQPRQNCSACHSGAQATAWKANPNRESCGSCHDTTSFEATVPTGQIAHQGGPMTDDSLCSTCHRATEDATWGIGPQHHPVDPNAATVEFAITGVTNTAPGQTPVVSFTVKVNGATRDIIAQPLTRLSVVTAGPTTDYASVASYQIQGTAPAAGGVLASNGSGGFTYTLPPAGAIASTATGTAAFGLEGYIQAATTGSPRYAGHNAIAYAAVTDTSALPRRQVVELARCNTCHADLAAHGGSRNDTQYCVLCHNPNLDNSARVPRLEGSTVVANPLTFKDMIHGIHMGELHDQPYVAGGSNPTTANPGGAPLSFNEVRFPRSPSDCSACHAAKTNELPIVATALPSHWETLTCTDDPAADTDAYCTNRTSVSTYTGPATAACTSCHDSPATAAHAALNTTSTGAEACATCHGPGKSFDAAVAHAPTP